MTDDNYGACVVLIPGTNNLPDTVEGGQHITLAYFGDEELPRGLDQELFEIVEKLAADLELSLDVETRELSYLGETEDARVLLVDDSDESVPVLLREDLLSRLTPPLQQIFEAAETWPKYQPHMTLGYISDGYDPSTEPARIPERLSIESIAFWNGTERIEFPLGGDEIKHYGILRKSGRYPWGSGENPFQRSASFISMVEELKAKGLTEAQIAEGLGLKNSAELRRARTIARNAKLQADIQMALRLKEKGMSNVAIGERMGRPESSIRALLAPALKAKTENLHAVSNHLKKRLEEVAGYLDVGVGVERHLGISAEKLKTAIAILEDEGYEKFYVQIEQLGTGNKTNTMVLAPPGTKFPEVMQNQDKIHSVMSYSDDGGRTWTEIKPPKPVSSDRVAVRYGPDGGADKDGVIELRRGVDELSLGKSRYAQVRISVDGTHYLKGMAVYSDNMPDGVDIIFNTNKKSTGNKLDAMKGIKDEKENPFGAITRQRTYLDSSGKTQQSPINVVGSAEGSGEEGGWSQWSRTLSSQMLSKQTPNLARQQLDLALSARRQEFEEINSLTNPVVKQHLLNKFADGADAAAVSLKAAALPRTSNHVILPVNSLKDNEVYAPNYRNGEKVVLIRHPHGGRFEIPELTVNNRNKEAQSVMGNAIDAVGINSRVAGRLSGADFDGDTVLVIPNGRKDVLTAPALAGLKNFDPMDYKIPAGSDIPPMRDKQKKMGDVSNLITDMTIKGATNDEIVRAVRHSMVVIDAEKHNLNYKQSAQDNGISELKKKYQGSPTGGASTLISRAKSVAIVPDRKPRAAKDGGPIDPQTGERVYTPTGEGFYKTKVNKRTGEVTEVWQPTTQRSTKMAEARDAHSLSSGTVMESVYANHANRLKALANDARKGALATKPIPYSPSAKQAYAAEVKSLDSKLNVALKNAPLERQAQVIANATIKARRLENPDLDKDALKKLKTSALTNARNRVGASKTPVSITSREWEAIQSGAVSSSKLKKILENTDIDKIRELATPRSQTGMTSAKIARAKALAAAGYTQAEIADALGVSASTINKALG